MTRDKFIQSKIDSIKWSEEGRSNKNFGTMGEYKLYAKSCYDQYRQHIGTIDYDFEDYGYKIIKPIICGKEKYYYYNCDKMEYFKTFEEAENWSKNKYIKSVKLKANWEYRKKNN